MDIWDQTSQKPMSDLKSAPSKQRTHEFRQDQKVNTS